MDEITIKFFGKILGDDYGYKTLMAYDEQGNPCLHMTYLETKDGVVRYVTDAVDGDNL